MNWGTSGLEMSRERHRVDAHNDCVEDPENNYPEMLLQSSVFTKIKMQLLSPQRSVFFPRAPSLNFPPAWSSPLLSPLCSPLTFQPLKQGLHSFFSFQDLVLGELQHLSTDRLPVCNCAQLTSLSALTNDVIDGQNKEEHTKKHFCLVWCVSKPSSSGC